METPSLGEQTARGSARGILIGVGSALLVIILALLTIRTGAQSIITGKTSLLVMAPAAFLAGIFSFLSPCTLPILPAYFAFTFQAKRERIVLMTVAFFLGLATTMVLIGATATALTRLLFANFQAVQLIGGLLVIGFGVMSLLGKGFSGMQTMDRPVASIGGSYLYGATFAFGWTACVGPILGGLLTLLGAQGLAVVQGGILAFIYALGLGMPLIIVAAFFSRLGTGSRFWQVMRGRGFEVNLGFTTLHLHTTSVLSGLLLIAMGALLASGRMAALSTWTLSTPLAQWSTALEAWVRHLFFGS